MKIEDNLLFCFSRNLYEIWYAYVFFPVLFISGIVFSLLSIGNKLLKESCCKNLIFLFLKYVIN